VAQEAIAPDGQFVPSWRIALLAKTHVHLWSKLKHNIPAMRFIDNLQIRILLGSALERWQWYVVVWCSSCSYLQYTRSKFSKTVKVTLTVTRDVGTVLRVTK
jgi:hypothetical protein